MALSRAFKHILESSSAGGTCPGVMELLLLPTHMKTEETVDEDCDVHFESSGKNGPCVKIVLVNCKSK